MADIKVLISEINGTELGLHEERLLQASDTTVSPAVEGQSKTQGVLEELADGLREYSYFEEEGEISTNSSTYQSALSFTTPSLRGGRYFVLSWYETSPEAGDKPAEIRTQIDGTTIGEEYGYLLDGGFGSGFCMKEVTLGAGTHTITIDYRRASNKSVSIRRRRVAIWRADGT